MKESRSHFRTARAGFCILVAAAVAVVPIGHRVAGANSGTTLDKASGRCVSAVGPGAPPAGFDPLQATPAELKCYGFPPRPKAPKPLATWENAMRHAKYYVPPPSFPPAGTVRTSYPSNWAGFDALTKDNATQYPGLKWSEVSSDFTVPTAHTYCTNALTYTWVGLGGDTLDGGSGNIIQAGTYSENYSPPSYGWWWEDYPGAIHPFSSPAVTVGDTVYVDVQYVGNNQGSFYFEDTTSGQYTSFPAATPYVAQDSADFIVENPNAPNQYVNFGSSRFSGTYMSGNYGTGGNSYVAGDASAFNMTRQVMYYNNTKAYPDNNVGTDGGFGVYSIGTNDPC